MICDFLNNVKLLQTDVITDIHEITEYINPGESPIKR